MEEKLEELAFMTTNGLEIFYARMPTLYVALVWYELNINEREHGKLKISLLKYGFCNKSFRKDEPLTS